MIGKPLTPRQVPISELPQLLGAFVGLARRGRGILLWGPSFFCMFGMLFVELIYEFLLFAFHASQTLVGLLNIGRSLADTAVACAAVLLAGLIARMLDESRPLIDVIASIKEWRTVIPGYLLFAVSLLVILRALGHAMGISGPLDWGRPGLTASWFEQVAGQPDDSGLAQIWLRLVWAVYALRPMGRTALDAMSFLWIPVGLFSLMGVPLRRAAWMIMMAISMNVPLWFFCMIADTIVAQNWDVHWPTAGLFVYQMLVLAWFGGFQYIVARAVFAGRYSNLAEQKFSAAPLVVGLH